MIRSELKKIFHSRVTVILILLFVLINGVVLWNLDVPGVTPYTNMDVTHILSLYKALPEDGKQALSALEGNLDVLTEAIWNETDPGGYLTEDIYTERQLFQTLIDRIEPVVNYSAILQEIETNAETLLLTGRYAPNSFGYRNVVKSRQIYGGLQDVEPSVLYSGAVELLPGGGITEVMAILLSLLVALELVFSERDRGTLALCKPTYKGGRQLISGKILAGLLWGTAGTLFLYGSNLLIGLIRCGAVDLTAPIQSVFGMIRSPWKLTIGEYIGLFFLIKILWVISVTGISFVISYIGRKVWQCCGLFLLLGGICFLRPDSVLNPFAMGNTVELFENYWNLNVFGSPVSNLAASVGGMILVSTISFCGAMILHVRQSPVISEREGKKKRERLELPKSLLSYEARKLLIMNGGVYILIGLVVLQIFLYSDFPSYISPQEQLYMRYSEILAGKADHEKDAYIEQEEARFAELYKELEEYGHALSRGDMKEDSYEILAAGIMRQLNSEPTFYRARDQYLQMKEQDLEYVCLTGYERILGTDGKKELLRQSICLILTLVAGLSGGYAIEHETGMILLLRTTEGERASGRKKRILAVLYGLVAAVVVYASQLIAVWISYGLPGITAAAGSVSILGLSIGKVWCVLGLYGSILAALSIGASLLILLLSNLTRNTIHTCLYSGALLLPPCILGLLLI